MPAREAYIDAGGLRTYVAQHGSGEPLLLLHGGLETADALPDLKAALAARHLVIAPERRGHGRTPDMPGPLTYEVMARDTLAVLDALEVPRADIVGYSDGANIAMLLAIGHPERIGRLVLVSGNFDADGMTRTFREELEHATAETYAPELAAGYRALTPDGPGHWPEVFEKIRRMWLGEPRLVAADLASITAPTLVLAGEDDYVSIEHTRALAAAIRDAQLRFVPGGSAGGVPVEQPERTTQAILEFLEAAELASGA